MVKSMEILNAQGSALEAKFHNKAFNLQLGTPFVQRYWNNTLVDSTTREDCQQTWHQLLIACLWFPNFICGKKLKGITTSKNRHPLVKTLFLWYSH